MRAPRARCRRHRDRARAPGRKAPTAPISGAPRTVMLRMASAAASPSAISQHHDLVRQCPLIEDLDKACAGRVRQRAISLAHAGRVRYRRRWIEAHSFLVRAMIVGPARSLLTSSVQRAARTAALRVRLQRCSIWKRLLKSSVHTPISGRGGICVAASAIRGFASSSRSSTRAPSRSAREHVLPFVVDPYRLQAARCGERSHHRNELEEPVGHVERDHAVGLDVLLVQRRALRAVMRCTGSHRLRTRRSRGCRDRAAVSRSRVRRASPSGVSIVLRFAPDR